MKKTPELLAPAGNYEAFLGALNAGADAFYLGGERFGARAYADNFNTEEICRALKTAHFYDKKIYLTVNTLVKEKELDEVYGYLQPLYEAGLDGVIVQDIGVMQYIGRLFPDLELHASTQMTLTGSPGAGFLKQLGVTRVVPARELSLDEIRQLKKETGMEVECFIHGAMCYCYSGQCLFSSILGGRSGNRGRCAQPCRLPYSVYRGEKCVQKECYPLSLKDMCTLSYLPALIEAGIDSFKIEGRMKKPEYAAGVTALYRKYIDLYEKSPEKYRVQESDMEQLRKLYIRSDIQTGYYEKHNGKEMITIHKPSYLGSDEALLTEIRKRYIKEPPKCKVSMKALLKVGEPVLLQIQGENESIQVQGETVQAAQKNPLTAEDVKRQLVKTGASLLEVKDVDVAMEGEGFLPVRALNALRRAGIEAYENAVILENGLKGCRTEILTEAKKCGEEAGCWEALAEETVRNTSRDILVHTVEQFETALVHECRRIYLESDLYLQEHEKITGLWKDRHSGREFYLALPFIIRKCDAEYLQKLKRYLEIDEMVQGFLVRNYEELALVQALHKRYPVVTDAGLYCFNRESLTFLQRYAEEVCLPYELNAAECRQVTKQARKLSMTTSMVVYGTIPMMVTANCIRKTSGECLRGKGKEQEKEHVYLKDRYDTAFPVETNCTHCFNVIYNSVPYSLHKKQKEIQRVMADVLRYDFVSENAKQMSAILEEKEFPFEGYTTGHIKRGIE